MSVFSTPIIFAAAKLVELDENVESLKRNDNSYSLSDTLNYYNVKKKLTELTVKTLMTKNGTFWMF